MKIVYICDKLITFILNEIIELIKMGHDVYILPVRDDFWVTHSIIRPILTQNGLLDKTFSRVRNYRNRKQKLVHLTYTVLYDFIRRPVVTLKALFYMLQIYPTLGDGTEAYLDIRPFFYEQIDVLHAPFSTPQILDKLYLFAKSLDLPYTLSFRAHDIYEGNVLEELKKRMNILREASQLITISEYNKNYLKSNLNLHRDIELIHGAVNIDFFTGNGEMRSPNSIIAVCRLAEQKGLLYLLKACHILHMRGVDYDCTIIGEGDQKKECQKFVEQLHIPNICFINFLTQPEIIKYLESATAFVMPCVISADGKRDILANALKEAMAMRIPVITSRICGIEELVDDELNGILVPPGNPEAVADAIIKLFSNPDLRETMGEEGRKKISKDFNIKTEGKKFESIFKKILNNNASNLNHDQST
ncbi:MAG: glycosyltransferase family 4 protein [Thermodesulfovibrionales bacterium]|nr:glycosyltransferase family 4 protein [Thermodesulfovibrionales bacterium]